MNCLTQQFSRIYGLNCKVGEPGGMGAGGHGLATFLLCKKKGNKGKKERVSKQKLLTVNCRHQGQNVTVLTILEHLESKNFSYWPTMVTDNIFQCSIGPPL